MAYVEIFSVPHFDPPRGHHRYWYPVCNFCKAQNADGAGEDWYDVDPATDLFGRQTWREALDLALNHLRDEHGTKGND